MDVVSGKRDDAGGNDVRPQTWHLGCGDGEGPGAVLVEVLVLRLGVHQRLELCDKDLQRHQASQLMQAAAQQHAATST